MQFIEHCREELDKANKKTIKLRRVLRGHLMSSGWHVGVHKEMHTDATLI